ncbi:hypothetical protein [Clostridium sp.]|jgi:Na+-driven multidrug efflux pump
MLVNALYNIVDRIFIGQVDTLALSGVTITFPISIIVTTFGLIFLEPI